MAKIPKSKPNPNRPAYIPVAERRATAKVRREARIREHSARYKGVEMCPRCWSKDKILIGGILYCHQCDRDKWSSVTY